MSPPPQEQHPDFAALGDSWDLSLRADGYAANTLLSYRAGLANFAAWLRELDPSIGPADVTREHIRGWIVYARETRSPNTARSWFPAVRNFFTWCVNEGEIDDNPTTGVKTPAPQDTTTPVLSPDDIRRLLATCTGRDFVARRDAAIIYLFADCGLRLAELSGLQVDDVNIRDRIVFVRGKGARRSGPRHRAVPFGVKCGQAVDRYLRERRRHPFAAQPQLWLGARSRATISADGIDAMLDRRGALAGVQLHPHMFRHSWASAFRAAGGSEGDLMVLGGWRNRAMLDRYGRAAAADRAHEAYRRLSLGDRL